jgi:hypothetical protein
VCVCVCVCVYVCMYVCMYVYLYIYVCVYVHTCIYTYMRTYIHTHTHTYIHTNTHTYIHRYIHAYTHTNTFTYTHIYTHTCTYIHTAKTLICAESQKPTHSSNFESKHVARLETSRHMDTDKETDTPAVPTASVQEVPEHRNAGNFGANSYSRVSEQGEAGDGCMDVDKIAYRELGDRRCLGANTGQNSYNDDDFGGKWSSYRGVGKRGKKTYVDANGDAWGVKKVRRRPARWHEGKRGKRRKK